jgi:hypothetical protein
MLMSNTQTETFLGVSKEDVPPPLLDLDFDFGGNLCAVVILMGTPVDFLLHINAIFAPEK